MRCGTANADCWWWLRLVNNNSALPTGVDFLRDISIVLDEILSKFHEKLKKQFKILGFIEYFKRKNRFYEEKLVWISNKCAQTEGKCRYKQVTCCIATSYLRYHITYLRLFWVHLSSGRFIFVDLAFMANFYQNINNSFWKSSFRIINCSFIAGFSRNSRIRVKFI